MDLSNVVAFAGSLLFTNLTCSEMKDLIGVCFHGLLREPHPVPEHASNENGRQKAVKFTFVLL